MACDRDSRGSVEKAILPSEGVAYDLHSSEGSNSPWPGQACHTHRACVVPDTQKVPFAMSATHCLRLGFAATESNVDLLLVRQSVKAVILVVYRTSLAPHMWSVTLHCFSRRDPLS